MKRKIIYSGCILLMVAFCALLLTSCRKNNIPQEDDVAAMTPLVRPKGVAAGGGITKTIGPAGGTLASGDGKLTITIPQGALSTATVIGIEPLSNTNIAGIGGAFRLTPHGQVFAKPVSLTCSWAADADSAGLLQTLGLAYQKDDGVWKYVGASSFDVNQKTVTFNTLHFSDWSLMNRISLSPYNKELETGQSQKIQALLFTQANGDDLLAPLTNSPDGPYFEPGYPVGNPVPLPSKFIRSWELNGPGQVTNSTSTSIEYQAPASVNGTAIATVTLELNAPVNGKFMLLSTLKITSDEWIEFTIGGQSTTRFSASGILNAGNVSVLSNVEDGSGNYFLLTWPGGLGTYTWDQAAAGVHFHFQTPETIYYSQYLNDLSHPAYPSGGNVTITQFTGSRVSGTFSVVNAGYGPRMTDKTTIQGKFKAKVFAQ
ncbi:MAG: hypothetical protein J7539_05400 [Niabella sp.]|nr:hypothetical protein [Niabella sp.]